MKLDEYRGIMARYGYRVIEDLFVGGYLCVCGPEDNENLLITTREGVEQSDQKDLESFMLERIFATTHP